MNLNIDSKKNFFVFLNNRRIFILQLKGVLSMFISKIISSLIYKKPQKMVKVLDNTIPGKSYEILNNSKKEIAKFTKENNIKKIYFSDGRRPFADDEFISPIIENEKSSVVNIIFKKGKDYLRTELNYFKDAQGKYIDKPENAFLSNTFNAIKKTLFSKESQKYNKNEIKSFENIDVKNV